MLNDLFVAPEFRGQDIGFMLLDAAAEYGRQTGCVRLTLYTEHSNIAAQAAYEAKGWIENTAFKTYNLPL